MDDRINSISKQKEGSESNADTIEIDSIMSQDSFVSNTTILAPVEIEELDASSINQMNFDMGEFVEAEAIKIDKIPEQLSLDSVEYLNYNHLDETVSDIEEQTTLSSEEENLLTKQFLNGELTFSEFTVRMDQDIDNEVEETQAG
jgi:general transcription factor 3C polypeptide 3 (transcription factor C subunit 4)